MPVVEAKCPNCGAALIVDNSKEAAVCEYCQTPYIVEKAVAGAITNSTISHSVINVYNQGEKASAPEMQMTQEEIDKRYQEEYKALKKAIRRDKIKWFLIAIIGALVSAIIGVIGYVLDKSNGAHVPMMVWGIIGTPALLLIAFKNLLTTTSSDARRIKKLNDAYENARLKKMFK